MIVEQLALQLLVFSLKQSGIYPQTERKSRVNAWRNHPPVGCNSIIEHEQQLSINVCIAISWLPSHHAHPSVAHVLVLWEDEEHIQCERVCIDNDESEQRLVSLEGK